MCEIETSRLRMRPIVSDDLPALARLWSDPDVMQYLPTGEPRSLEATQAELAYMVNHWHDHGFGVWAVTLKGEDHLIGYCGLQHLHVEPGGVTQEALGDAREVEVVATFEKEYWSQGIATEATRAVLRYGFEVIELPRVVAAIHPDNQASRRILEHKMGLKHEPSMRYYGDCPHLAITREEFKANDSRSSVHPR